MTAYLCRAFFFACCSLFLTETIAAAQESCAAISRDIPIESTVATASAMPNIFKLSGSVLAESRRLVDEALQRKDSPPRDLCPETCELAQEPLFVFRSAPLRQLRGAYSESETCAALESQTTHLPIRYRGRSLPDVDGVITYISNLTRGKGEDGEHLYQRCPGRCSPRLVTYVRHNDAGLLVDTDVICGHARDKKDYAYALSIGLRWSCRNTVSARR